MAVTKTNNSVEGYTGPYLERSGVDTRSMVETLIRPPELPLNEVETKAALEFEAQLFNHEIGEGLTIGSLPAAVKNETATAPQFFAEAFLKGKVTMPDMETTPAFKSTTDVYKWLATAVRDSTIDQESLMRMANESADYYINTASEILLNGGKPDTSLLDYSQIVIDPVETIRLSQAAIQARQYLTEMRKLHREGGERLEGAKRALVDVYSGKVNRIVVGNITTLDYLVDQSRLIGDEATEKAANSLIPSIIARRLDTFELATAKTLDLLRNGKAVDKDGEPTGVDDVVLEYTSQSDKLASVEPLFNNEQAEKLKAYKLSPVQMVDVYSCILNRGGLLSSEDPKTWSPKRKTKAADELYQVVVNPGRNIFQVDGFNGAFKVPRESRSLFDCITVGGFHELEHVNQDQIDQILGRKLKIAAVKGRRTSMLLEGGANFKQRQAENVLFGKCKPISLAYARALKVVEAGGSIFDAALASFDEKQRTMPNSDRHVLARQAVKSVLRLKAHGGIDSQPMAYAEEVIMDRELANASDEIKARAVAVTSLDFVDQVRLYKYGLLDLPESTGIDWTEIIMKEFEPYINDALSE